jgi:hypothetical protein
VRFVLHLVGRADGRLPQVRIAVAVAVLSSLLAVGCGSNGAKRRGAQPSPRASSADELAYVQIARASGTLRTNAAAAALGRAVRIANPAAIASAAQLVRDVRPRNQSLMALALRMHEAMASALRAGHDRRAQRSAAMAALKATDNINLGLRHYAARHPELRALIPD